MNPRVQWDSLQALFEGALERSPAERSAFVRAHTDDEGVRREVEALLAAHEQAGGFLMEAALGPGRGDSAPVNEPRLPAGRRLGAFEIVGVVGSGGWARSIAPAIRGSIGSWRSRCSHGRSTMRTAAANGSSAKHAPFPGCPIRTSARSTTSVRPRSTDRRFRFSFWSCSKVKHSPRV